LLDFLYSTERPIPDKKTACRAANARTFAQRSAVVLILKKFFICTPKGWTHKRFEEELTHAESRRNKAAKAWKSRWSKDAPSNARANAPSNATPDSRLQTPEVALTFDRSNGAARAVTERENFARARFESFWSAYPNKLDRDQAYQHFLVLSPIDQDTAAKSVPLWVASEQWKEIRFVPNPVSFLKKRRFDFAPPIKPKEKSLHEQLREVETKHGIRSSS
jgi:uncharacterized protein YdaU (DUF1376 family)